AAETSRRQVLFAARRAAAAVRQTIRRAVAGGAARLRAGEARSGRAITIQLLTLAIVRSAARAQHGDYGQSEERSHHGSSSSCDSKGRGYLAAGADLDGLASLR